MEMIFRVGFQATVQLLGYKDGNYYLRKGLR